MSVFITSGLHLQHKNCSIWRGFDSVEEHDETIIENWNKVVLSKRDVVWVLGDVCFASADISILDRLIGIKHLVVGNHEHHDMSKYVPYFHKIVSSICYKTRYLFTHIPVHSSQLDQRFKMVNVHGHVHKDHPELYLDKDARYFNVKTEFHNYTPIRMEDLDEMVRRKQEGWYNEYTGI
jgi:calcineurin-like phosphoesterase family protein